MPKSGGVCFGHISYSTKMSIMSGDPRAQIGWHCRDWKGMCLLMGHAYSKGNSTSIVNIGWGARDPLKRLSLSLATMDASEARGRKEWTQRIQRVRDPSTWIG